MNDTDDDSTVRNVMQTVCVHTHVRALKARNVNQDNNILCMAYLFLKGNLYVHLTYCISINLHKAVITMLLFSMFHFKPIVWFLRRCISMGLLSFPHSQMTTFVFCCIMIWETQFSCHCISYFQVPRKRKMNISFMKKFTNSCMNNFIERSQEDIGKYNRARPR